MLHKTARIITENLARSMDRRAFLKRTSETVFVGMASLAAGHVALTPVSAKQRRQPPNPTVPTCAPPGPYCNTNGINEPNGCHGSSCFQHLNAGQVQQCRVYYIYQAGCWTTAVSGGYWVCCDCRCDNNSTCGCAQFSASPVPRPDTPDHAQA